MPKSILGAIGTIGGSLIGGPVGGAIGGALGGAVGSAVGANKQASAAKSAANSQYASTQAAIDQENAQYAQTQTDQAPFKTSGVAANGELQYLLGLNGDTGVPGGYDGQFGSLAKPFTNADFVKDPGYDFRMQQGQQALERSAAAKGGLMSGAALKAITQYGQNFASNEYGAAYNRYNANQQNLFSRLSGQQAVGQNSANTVDALGSAKANAVAGLDTDAGNVTAAGKIGAGNAWSTGLNNVLTPLNGTFGGGVRGSGSLNQQAGLVDSNGFDATAYANGMPWSDIRLKDNIIHKGVENGHNVYEFSYKGDDKRYIGVMAQEVQQVRPDAIYKRNGYLCVDYDAIGVRFRGN